MTPGPLCKTKNKFQGHLDFYFFLFEIVFHALQGSLNDFFLFERNRLNEYGVDTRTVFQIENFQFTEIEQKIRQFDQNRTLYQKYVEEKRWHLGKRISGKIRKKVK